MNNEPIIVCDIGARGVFHPRWQRIAHRLHAIAIDADERAAIERPQCVDHSVIRAALWSDALEMNFNVCRSPGASSFFEPNRQFLARFKNPERCDIMTRIPMKTVALDSLNIRPHFIKIDTQGAEAAILNGAHDTLRSLVGVEIEVEFHPIYNDVPLYPVIDLMLKVMGFELWDMNSYYWRDQTDGKMRQIVADALYFKRPELIVDKEIFAALADCYRVTSRQALSHAFQWALRAVQRNYHWDCDMQLGH